MKPNFYAYIEDFGVITVMVPVSYKDDPSMQFEITGPNEIIPCELKSTQTLGDERQFILTFQGHVLLNEPYLVRDDAGETTPLKSGKIVRTSLFDDIFYYDGDLGAVYSIEHTTFRVWSPTAQSMTLNTYGDSPKSIPMTYKNQGIWEVTLSHDCHLLPYDFNACVNERNTSFIDPYGVASTANGEKSVVINPSLTYKMHHERPAFSGIKTDAIIYEVSVRDLTYQLNTHTQSTYLGVTEPGLKTKQNHPAGLDYLKSLGVTHIQLLPIFDFEGVDECSPKESYNWGYNPSQYNVPEGSLSSNPTDPLTRINELKEMIDRLHEEGFRVIMDVVYNHVYETETFPFEQIIPGYAFRVDHQGILTNASGCGNDLATERLMIRKFILDSVKHWVTFYQIDGFRFDLMGLMDVKTVNRIYQTLEAMDEHLIIYGEGWKIPTGLKESKMAHMDNPRVLFTTGFFNDHFRETVKGATFHAKGLGFISGGKLEPHAIQSILTGSVLNQRFRYPTQSMNYIECHDNYTVYDKLALALHSESEASRKTMQEIGTAMVILAQGVPFIHNGQEFFRTKHGVENSYNHPDSINHVNWDLLDENLEVVERFKALIALRKSEPLFRLRTASAIKAHTRVTFTPAGTVLYHVFDDTKHYTVIFKPNDTEETLELDNQPDLLFSLKDIQPIESPLHLHGKTCMILLDRKEP